MTIQKKSRKGVSQLLLGGFIIWLFIFKITPLLTAKGQPAKVMQYITEHDIDATPLFYTESEEANAATYYLVKSKGTVEVER